MRGREAAVLRHQLGVEGVVRLLSGLQVLGTVPQVQLPQVFPTGFEIDQQGQLGRLGEVERTGGGVFRHGGTTFVGDNRAARRPRV